MNKKYKVISVVALVCFLGSTISYAKYKTGELINMSPYAYLSASVIHPKKLDLVLMTDYAGSQKSTLVNAINGKINNLFNKNVDAKLYVEDTSNSSYSGNTYFQQGYNGAPTGTNNGITPSSGGSLNTTSIDSNNALGAYKRRLKSGFGTFTWNNDNSVTFQWSSGISAANQMGEAPTTITGPITLTDAPTNIASIGASKHSLYILTTDNKLYMSGNATMAGEWRNAWMGSFPNKYTGMRLVLTDIKDIKSNYNGIAALRINGDVFYAGNVGLAIANGEYSPIYDKSMNVAIKGDPEYSYTSLINDYIVTEGFQLLPGMKNITRIQLGNQSIIGLNDNTGDCYGIGYNQGQFGWGDPYFRASTADEWSKKMEIPVVLNAKKIPLLDARKIKELYMYGLYTKVIQKDNGIYRLTGGGFTTKATDSGVMTSIFHEAYSSDVGTYMKIGSLKSNDLFEIDTAATYSVSTVKTDNFVLSSSLGYNVNCFFTKYTYSINVTGTTIVKKDGTATTNTLDLNNISNTYTSYFNGIKQINSLNVDDVINKVYRDGSDKVLIYVSDNTSTEFSSKDLGAYYPMTGLSYNFMSFLSKNNFGIYIVTPASMLDYIGNPCTGQEVSLRQISNSTTDGHVYNQGNYIQALNEVEAKYARNEEPLSSYVIVNEDIVKYNKQFRDKENDTKKDERFMYNHNPNVFLNPMGVISTNKQWLSTPITTFDKAGEYKTTYQVQDDPSLENNFNNYNKWSNQTEQLNIIAHRRPIAKFTAKIPKELVSEVEQAENFDNRHEITTVYNPYCTIQNNGYGGTKALNGASTGTVGQEGSATITINVPEGATNAQFKYVLTSASCNITLDGGVIATSADINSIVSIPLTIGTHTLSVSTVFTPRYRAYDDNGIRYWVEAVYGKFTLDNLQLTYNTKQWVNGSSSDYTPTGQTNITYNNKSYDIDHTDVAENQRQLNPVLPDKGINKEEWKWIDITSGGTWQSGKLITYTRNHVYQISLRVQDIEGAWSNPYILALGDFMPEIPEPNNPPVAKFSLNTNIMTAGTANSITDLSFDPDGDPLAHWNWRLYNESGNLLTSYGETKPNLSTLAIGKYILKLSVQDKPKNPPALWSVDYALSFTVRSNLQLTGILSPNPSKRGQKVTITATTDGSAEDLTFYFPYEITSLDKDTVFPIYKGIKVEDHHVEKIEYVLPMDTPYTLDRDGNRLRQPYLITVVASKSGQSVSVDLQLDVKGNIYDSIKTELK